MSTTEAGAVVSLFGLGALFASPTGGFLADTIGRKATLLTGLVLSATAMVALGFNTSPRWIGFNTLVLGFTSELFRPAVSAVVADVVPPNCRLKAYAAMYWAANVGFSIAPVLAGFMASRSYLALFIADAATTALYAALVLWRVPETRPGSRPFSHQAASNVELQATAQPQPQVSLRTLWDRLGFAAVLKDRVFITFVGLCFLMWLLFFQHNSTLALELRAHHVRTEQFGMILAVNGLLIVSLQPFAAGWLLRFRRSQVLAIAAVLTGLGFGVNAWADSVPFYVAGVIIWTLGEIAHSPVSAAVVADLAPVQARGRYQGMFSMAIGSASFAGPALGGYVMERFGSRALWLGCIGLGAVVAAGNLLAGATVRRHIEGPGSAGLVATPETGEQPDANSNEVDDDASAVARVRPE